MSEERKLFFDGKLEFLNKDLPFGVWVVDSDHTVREMVLTKSFVGGPKTEDGDFVARWFEYEGAPEDTFLLPDFDEFYETRKQALEVALADLEERQAKLEHAITVLRDRQLAVLEELRVES